MSLAEQLAERARRRRAYPLAYLDLWDRAWPRTSQRRAIALLADPAVKLLAILGGNRSGKSLVMAAYLVACAMGRDYCVHERRGRIYPVRMWLARNQLPEELIPDGPGIVWAASPDFTSSLEQIRPHITRLCPEDAHYVGWKRSGPAHIELRNGGRIVGKAYRQYTQNPQTWEGASGVRAIGLDEQPDSYANFLAALSRLADPVASDGRTGKMVNALTPLRGRGDWHYREIGGVKAQARNPEYRVTHLYGEDNPNMPAGELAKIIAKFPAWQRAARDRGEYVDATGAVYPMDPEVHLIDPFVPPLTWPRIQVTDWGGRTPHALWLVVARGPYTVGTHQGEEGDIIAYREYAPRIPRSEPRLRQDELIATIKRMETEAGEGECTVYRVADSEDPNAIEAAAVAGLLYVPAAKGKGVLTAGIARVESALQTATSDGAPRRPELYLTRSVPVTWDEMADLRYPAEVDEGTHPDERKPDDGADHGPDCVRYALQFLDEAGRV